MVGCGFVTMDRHLPAVRHVPDVAVVALVDTEPERAAELAARLAPKARAASLEEVLGDPTVEALAVCTPPASHLDVALAGLDAGKHLLVEKPISASLEDADRLIAAAAQSGARVMVGFNLRRHRLVERARRVLRAGRLGTVQALRTAFTSPILDGAVDWQGRRSLGGGALLDRAVHHFDLWRFLLGTEIVEVSALTQSRRGDDQSAVITARAADGLLVTTLVLDDSAVSQDLAIYGTDGAVFVDCCRVDGFHLAPRREPPGSLRSRLRRARESLEHPSETVQAIRRGGDFRVGFEEQWRHFAHAIREGIEPSPSLADGRAAMEIAVAAARSADSGLPVGLRELQVAS
jgi:predicted dehydrogenase